MSRTVNAQKNNFQYDRTGPTKIIPPYDAARSSCAPKDQHPFNKVMHLLVFSI